MKLTDLTFLMMAVCALWCDEALADDLPALRPPIQSARPAVQSAPPAGTATDAARADFDQHLSSLKHSPRSQPTATPTGASPGRLQAILLKNAPAAATGPGAAHTAGDEQWMTMERPKLESLISVNEFLNPFQLDAASNRHLSLRDALQLGIDRNLDLAIGRTNTKQRMFSYFQSLGNFLPDPTLGYNEFFTKGRIGIPVAITQLGSGGGANALGAASVAGNNGDTTIKLVRPFIMMHAGGDWYAYRGGQVLFGALSSRNQYRAAKHQEHATLSDVLMTITKNYYNLVLAESLLKIRIDAVTTSEENLRKNKDTFAAGLATNLDVLQSKTQLSRDRQALVDQQINRRNAAITLAESLNIELGADVLPVDLTVKKVRLIDPKLTVGNLLSVAIDHRPELKQYEQLRLAAKKQIMVSAAGLQPTVSLSGNVYGIGPPTNVQAVGVFALRADWRLKGLGTVDAMKIEEAKWQARQASLESAKQLQSVCKQVRNSYLQILDKERNIEEATSEVASALEELRLAELRKQSGLGINLDIISAQRDYTQARVNKAQAIIDFDIAQAQLLHDLGLISTDALTSGRALMGVPGQ